MTRLPPLVLASASPRRADLLRQLGLQFRVQASQIPEDLLPGETPEAHVERLSRAKALEIWDRDKTALVVAGDTIVVLEGKILGKPSGSEEAVEMLMALSGKTHVVTSGLALAFPHGHVGSGSASTEVTFSSFDKATARAYVDTGEPMDKAGAYGIQGLGVALVRAVQGDYTTVVGLPVALFLDLLFLGGLRYQSGALVPIPRENSQ